MELTPGYKQTEVGVISGWRCTSVVGIAASTRNAIVGGPFGSDLVSNDYVVSGVPVIRGQNMGLRWVSGDFAFVTREKAKALEANLARPGDLVFTQRGTLGQVSLVPTEPHDCYVVSQSQMKLTVNREIADPRFLYYVFTGQEQQEIIRQNAIQTGVPHINLGILRGIPVLLPPVPEQEAIAEALSDADAFIESLEQLIAKKRHIKQGAMQELLTGRKRLPGFGGEWKGCVLADCLLTNPDYGINAPGVPLAGGLPAYLRITDIDDDGRYLSCNRVSVSHAQAMNYLLSENEIVFARTGASVGKTYLYDAADGELVFAGFLIRAKIDCSRLCPAFLAAFTRTQRYWSWVRTMSMRSGQPGINGNEYAALTLHLPPSVEEQEAIARALVDMDTEISALEAKLAKTRQLKQGMMQELLAGRIRLL